MKPLLSISIFILSSLFCMAQNPVDFEMIKSKILDENSESYYPRLIEIYENGTSELSLEEKRYCYYGFVFDPSYEPYSRPKGTDLVDSLIKTEIDTLRINSILDSTMAIYPFDLKTIAYKIRYSNSFDEKTKLKRRTDIIFDAVSSSGNGSEKSPFTVIFLPHELLVVDRLNLERNGKQNLGKSLIDIVGIEKNDRKIKKLFFDVSCLKPAENVLYHQFYHAYINLHEPDYEIK